CYRQLRASFRSESSLISPTLPQAASATLASGLWGLLHNANQHPGFALGQGTTLFDGDNITFAALVCFIVCHQLGGTAQELAVHRVLHATLNQYSNGFVRLGGHNLASNAPAQFLRLCHISCPASLSGWSLHARYRDAPVRVHEYGKAARKPSSCAA